MKTSTLLKSIILITLLTNCGGSLSDEQRKKFKEGMEQQKIVKVSDSEIVSAALEQGQTIFKNIENVNFNEAKLDSIEAVTDTKIKWIVPGSGNAADIENQLIEAYILGMATGSVQDNIQKLRTGNKPEDYDTLIYSKPIVTKMPDGADKLEGIWNIYLAKKNVVLELSKKK